MKIFTKKINKSLFLLTLSFFVLSSAPILHGYVMSSGSYKVESDSVNFGGGDSSSASYGLSDTLGEVGTGQSDSSNYRMQAGYRQMLVSYLSLSSITSVTLSPSIGGVSGGTSDGSTSFTVITDNPAGYTATIKASSSPALVSGANSFADYVPAGSDPDFTFSVSANDSEFGFSPEGSHVVQRFKDNGTTCNTGSGETASSCWVGLSTTAITIAESSSQTLSGTVTTLKFRAKSGSTHIQPSGSYYATTTVTVVSL